MHKIVVATVGMWLLLVGQSHAATKSRCPEKVLETATVEGIYQGTSCEDFCYSSIKLDNGEDFVMFCGEEMAEQFFGKPGRRVTATYEVQQFWNELGNECTRAEVCKTGNIVDAKANKLGNTPSVIGVYTVKTSEASGEIRISKSNNTTAQYNLDASVTNLPNMTGLCEAHMLCDQDESGLLCFDIDENIKQAWFIEIELKDKDSLIITKYSSEMCGVGATFAHTYMKNN